MKLQRDFCKRHQPRKHRVVPTSGYFKEKPRVKQYMGKVISWEHLRILPCFPGRKATSIYGALLFAKFSRLWQANGQRGRAGKRKLLGEDLMDEEDENPNLQSGTEGLLAIFLPPNPRSCIFLYMFTMSL